MSPYTRLRTVRRATVTASAVLGACAALVIAGTGAASAGSGAVPGIRYVALGDSFASGYGITPVQDAGCGRGATNYPSVLRAVAQPQSYQNVACSGATTRSIWNAEGGEPKQISALKKDTNLVTVTIGGNDIGFTELVTTCATLGLRQPTGDPCRQTYKEGTADKILTRLDAVKSRFADVVTDVKRKSPEATVALVGYPSLLPDSGKSCRSAQVPFADGDFQYLRNITVRLNRVLAEQARKAGALYIDTYTPSIGHDMCQSKKQRWIEPLFTEKGPSGGIAPAAAHPNLPGIISLGGTVSQALAKHMN
ncbi:SGNH/GDSL hydrolase family protein [Nonomuraea sp. NPDC050451]|uniref:SGNH/GDSL hydrolase family protein n=1 Tax=Nonomuraea sp. NPDC050451 TaxID=3364364 RepID=UPI00379A2BA9